MGGELVWTYVRTNSDDEYDESWDKLDTSGEDEDPNNCWFYRPSAFHELKGLALRAGIQYLESIQQQVNERKSAGNIAGSRQFLSEAGIIAAAGSPTDEQALADASAVVLKAISLLRSWLREPVLTESGYPEPPMTNLVRLGLLGSGGGALPLGGLEALGGLVAQGAGGGAAMDEMLNSNLLFSEVSKHACCPATLHRVGLGGLYYFAKMSDNNQFIYPFEARVLAAMFTRILDYLPDTLDWKQFAGGLRDLLQKCGEDEMTMIQG